MCMKCLAQTHCSKERWSRPFSQKRSVNALPLQAQAFPATRSPTHHSFRGGHCLGPPSRAHPKLPLPEASSWRQWPTGRGAGLLSPLGVFAMETRFLPSVCPQNPRKSPIRLRRAFCPRSRQSPPGKLLNPHTMCESLLEIYHSPKVEA